MPKGILMRFLMGVHVKANINNHKPHIAEFIKSGRL
jgi:hypothetical protein